MLPGKQGELRAAGEECRRAALVGLDMGLLVREDRPVGRG